jgi:Flp pilus assembly pilin Flp
MFSVMNPFKALTPHATLMMRLSDMFHALKRYTKDTSGVGAIEFALIVPLLLLAFFGVSIITQAIVIDRKVALLSDRLADIAARSDTMDEDQAKIILAAMYAVIQPYDPARAAVRVSGISTDSSGVTRAKWSYSCFMPERAADSVVNDIAVPAFFAAANRHGVVAEVRYDYLSILSANTSSAFGLPQGFTLSEVIYQVPRNVDEIIVTNGKNKAKQITNCAT